MRPVTVRCIFTTIQFQHPAHDTQLSDTVFHCNGWPVFIPRPKVWVRWTECKVTIGPPHKMWVGGCTGCGYSTQYWNWGATMGAVLWHRQRGCNK